MFVKTQYETVVNLTHYSVIKIDYSQLIHGSPYHQIWVETADGKNKVILAHWKVDINNPTRDIKTVHATKSFDAIFEKLSGGETTFDLKAYIADIADNIPF